MKEINCDINFCEFVQKIFELYENEEELNNGALFLINDIMTLRDDAICKLRKQKWNESNKSQ